MQYSDPIKEVLSLSDAASQAFLRAGIESVSDLLFHLPIRYEDRSHLNSVASFQHDSQAYVHAQVVEHNVVYGRRKMLSVRMRDKNDDIFSLKFFHFYPSQQRQFTVGKWGLFYGKVNASSYGFEMVHPEIEWLKNNQTPLLSDKLHSIYATIKGLPQKKWQVAIAKVLKMIDQEVEDPLTGMGYLSSNQAIQTLHLPGYDQSSDGLLSIAHPARQRLLIEELSAHQLSLLQAKKNLRRLPAVPLDSHQALLHAFMERLSFELTAAQKKVIKEINADLSSKKGMLRLVQGDVGSGKTIVALIACLQAIGSGKQAIFMAPTELLAQQHAEKIIKILAEFDIKVLLYVSKMSAAKKREALASIADGSAQLIIGTHAVFQEKVVYKDLALIVIDEQHRFGVHQRLSLQEKAPEGKAVHQLVLTATPIPRTLAMSAYGELDTSVIDALPSGRKAVQTAVINNQKRDEIIQRVGERCRKKEQSYWVCPLIEESDVLECENAEAIADYIQSQLPDIKVGLVHGRLDAKQRQMVMSAFVAGELDLLVATTVIEVGVDVANASMMVIENAERFGLSQLHQLRGRVGRGNQQSYCILLYQSPVGKTAKKRLDIMRQTNDGFLIAEEDLKIRGAGELLGTRQTGDLNFKIADLERDGVMLEKADVYIQDWQRNHPNFCLVLTKRWIGDKSRYYQV